MVIVVCPFTGARLCNDNQWRTFAHFGTGRTCVKEYRSATWALKAGARYRRLPEGWVENDVRDIAKCIHLNAGDTMDAAGNVTRKH